MYKDEAELQGQFFGPLCQVWTERLNAAASKKKRFNAVAQQCTYFYESQAGFMWREDFKKDYFNGNLPSPKFQITIAKAFEFVSIFGPHLFWQYPSRKVISQRTLKLKPEVLAGTQPPEVVEQIMQQEAIEEGLNNFANNMMENYLNFSQREQPGGLATHAQMAITEFLIKGMGLLWPETYQFPDSDTVFTKLCYDSVDNLLIDPDCNDPLWESAGYISRRHVTPIWKVEQTFGLKRGSLAGKGTYASGEQTARNQAPGQGDKKHTTFDCIEWHEVWSKVGVGPRSKSLSHHMLDEFDELIGDYAYLCIAPGVNYPLNAPPERFFGEDAATSEQVTEMFQWRAANYGAPFPCQKDNRWPVAPLWSYPVGTSPWPLAPLAPGLGELICLNVLTSSYVDQSWGKRKTIIASLKSASAEIKRAIGSDEAFEHVELNESMGKALNETVQFLQQASSNNDILQAMDIMASNFDKRVGLHELHYGSTGHQIRVASEVRERSASASIRPDKMASDVASFITNASQLEMFLAALHVRGVDLTHLLGSFGASQWDQHFSQMPITQIMREMKATVESSDVRRPNRERDTANVQAMQQYILPMLHQYAQTTTETGPLNEFIRLLGKSMEMNVDDLELPPWTPPTDPEQQELQKAGQQLELQNTAADTEQKKSVAQKNTVDAIVRAKEASVSDSEVGEAKHIQELRHKDEAHDQAIIHKQEEHAVGLITQAISDQQKEQAAANINKGSES